MNLAVWVNFTRTAVAWNNLKPQKHIQDPTEARLSETDEPAFVFGTKADTLMRLAPNVPSGRFCDQVIIPVRSWIEQRDAVITDVLRRFKGVPLAVRSSANGEDSWENSMAGQYASFVNITPEAAPLGQAIERVIASYGARTDEDQVLVQPTVHDVAISGVAITRDLDTGAPYIVINYDDVSGRTDTVTAGSAGKTILVHRSRPEAVHSSRFRKLVDILREIEIATGRDELDVEFCITTDETVFVLQVRPIAAKARWNRIPDLKIDATLSEIRTMLTQRMAPQAGLAGSSTILGEMPDWNPAEIIGNSPQPLALSLYKRQITDETWWRARAEIGYRQVRHPLLVDLTGRPYVDVRLSLNSFLPCDLEDDAAEQIVNAELAILAENRELHDKLEFDVAVTCSDFCIDENLKMLADRGVARPVLERFRAHLDQLTGNILSQGPAGVSTLVDRTERLSSLSVNGTPTERVRGMLDACIEDGTLPFSILARYAFIGVAFLRSLVRRGALSQDRSDEFMRTINTVATELVRDMYAAHSGDLSWERLMDRYGHLRPGTYDITSPRYDEWSETFLGQQPRKPSDAASFDLTAGEREDIRKLLAEAGFSIEAELLLEFVSASVRARESAKFAFTRTLSDAMSLLVDWGDSVGLDRTELAMLPIEEILNCDDRDVARLRDLVAEGQAQHNLTRAIRLPQLIAEPDDIDVVRISTGQPNFITNISVTAQARFLGTNEAPDIQGCIVLTDSADPGFDWIFSHTIRGLITKYGGANSHMAIRCAEFGLPAAIGCGERLFEQLREYGSIELNCGTRTIRAVGH